MSPPPSYFPTMSVDKYLALESRSEIRHEYDNGLMYLMAEISEDHMMIAGNVNMLINGRVDDIPCQPFMYRMRVCLPEKNYYYPDVVVTCGERLYESRLDHQTLLNPLVLVEVSSEETDVYNRTRKLEVYQYILSLRDYLIVSEDRVYITHHTQSNGNWASYEYTDPTAEIVLSSIDCKLPLARIYKKVSWA